MGNILQQEHKKTQGVENFTCGICLKSRLPVYKKFRNYSNNNNEEETKECASKHHFCIKCIAKYIQVRVSDYGRSVTKCPHSNCSVGFEILSCRSLVSTQVFVRWCDLLCESEIQAKFGRQGRRVYCPCCSEVILNECGDDGITRTTCPSCHKLFCLRCIIPLTDQERHTCNSRDDLVFLNTAARKGWTRCPSCNQSVERTFGCNIIECRCGNEFCYHFGNHAFKCYPRAIENQAREELDPFMLSVHFIFIGFAMMSIMGKPEFMNHKPVPASLEFGRTYVVRPKGKHQATVVWLHDLGANGFSSYQLLEALPIRNIKWICPTAPVQPIEIAGGFSSTAWFNMPDYSEDALINMEGLDASVTHVAKLLSKEPNYIKLGVGGFGMGSAIALYAAACAVEGKLSNGRPYPHNLSAVVSISGWLPMA
ncbi:hypothetical protein MKW94_000119, partial [Papaver nudicaule]|nr:hypothetical protein [Papaver nudicaule]